MRARSRSTWVAVASLLVLAAVFVTMVAVLTPWDPLPGADSHAADARDYFSAREIARGEAFHDDAKWPSWIALAVNVVVAAVLAFTPVGRRLVHAVRRRTRRWWLQVVGLVVLVLVISRLATLPFAIWSTRVGRDYGLVTQSWGDWTLDRLKSLGVSVVLTSVALLLLVWVARRFPRRWFVPAAAGAGALVVAVSFAYPVVVEPIFNDFRPMTVEPLRRDLLQMAADDGQDVSDVLVADASRRTTALNAYVSGFGATKRIVVYDTMLRSAPNNEVELIVAHELGHSKNRDVLVGTLEGAVAAMLAIVALYLALKPAVLRRRIGAGSAADPAIVPVVLGLVVIVGLAAAPVENVISRHIEARADVHSLDLTHDPDTFIAMQRRLAITNLDHLDPNPFLSFWFASHPPTLDRIGMALAWERLHDDEPRGTVG